MPAAISLGLLLLETLFLIAKLPETKGYKVGEVSNAKRAQPSMPEPKDVFEDREQKLQRLKDVTHLHGYFLLFFSGVSVFTSFSFDDLADLILGRIHIDFPDLRHLLRFQRIQRQTAQL